ncbi:MAG TPA: hypothetical protein VN026_14880 [Bacteroidia bacterium]|jgi:hypothetical protein|nr:hypothetical protein [Bacteroidia bacterium]
METQEGRQPSEDDNFYVTWGRETIKNNITLANDILKQLVAISSALLGVTIIYEKVVSNEILKVCVLLSFLLALVISFLGVLPYEAKVQLNVPSDIKEHKRKALVHKLRLLWISAISLMVGFSFVIAELISKLI